MKALIISIINALTMIAAVAAIAANSPLNLQKLSTDSEGPIITAFSMPMTSTSLTIQVALSATDNTGVSSYCISESNDSGSCSWSATPPASYTFASPGYKLLYAFARDAANNVSGSATAYSIIVTGTSPFNIVQALSDGAQGTTIAFAGFGMITGKLGAQSFFPPGKVADYWGFQYLRDNDPDNMGHNTSFLTRVSCNILYILNDTQIASLKNLAQNQVDNINLYAWKRYPLMQAFRRLIDGAKPTGATGLNLTAVKAASRELYLLDGQISYERAITYANIYRSLSTSQKAYIDAMVGKGFNSWPDKSEVDVRTKLQGLPSDVVVAMMTYAGDLYSWYAGSVDSDVYFCPERHGTYFGSFYMKDAPAIGHPGYSIDEQMTATIGKVLCDSSFGYISDAGAAKMNALTSVQKLNLYANPSENIVLARTRISEALRSLIVDTAPSEATLAQVKATVDNFSAIYGMLDGENNFHYATTFAQLNCNIAANYFTTAQKAAMTSLRKQYMTVTYPDGTTADYSSLNKYYLYGQEIPEGTQNLAVYTSDNATNGFFSFGSASASLPSLLLLQ
ncbi:hypothetical protein [Solidesulfovibrio magneticus]|uniref:Uncharacterized protein n=1 Tax=Solidesulfovibrio magneticus (strain ATCC 700980 / DSM 13731 / RS-1) TaxID=573370 RepID=C4XTX9_SOLM1|nr:hypothetical protein [Solidesulfovibrio magneticus]BAH73644.1 hypothetical protein DMR_01530 [Solidesulfovibrio magneticus RS-1]